jgi:general secretion pathway protein D
VPFLRDVPVLGAFFGRTSEISRRTELVVLITPRMVQSTGDARQLTEEYRKRMNSLKQRAEQTLGMPAE